MNARETVTGDYRAARRNALRVAWAVTYLSVIVMCAAIACGFFAWAAWAELTYASNANVLRRQALEVFVGCGLVAVGVIAADSAVPRIATRIARRSTAVPLSAGSDRGKHDGR
ncbi:Uncharacterised protein [Mycobacteroides abscessus subsp. abscessus]|nr:Uncharacterised protein [Mycobacteroides abscessus subsp. abscessus]